MERTTSQQLCIMFNKRFDYANDSDEHDDDGADGDDVEEDRTLS